MGPKIFTGDKNDKWLCSVLILMAIFPDCNGLAFASFPRQAVGMMLEIELQ